MYLSHFQLNLKPFQLNSDRRFLFLSEKHEEALAILRYGILDNRGVLVLTGDVGTGKTLLIHALVETLGPGVRTALITDPSLKGLDFFKYMTHAFGMEVESKTKGEFLINFENFLEGLSEANQKALLIVDEAQCMPRFQLEEIRILSNFERGDNRLNIFFVGQNEFDSVIADKQLRALKQRITTYYHIAPLTLEETGLYVQYRLKVAGCDRPLFTPSALEKIFGLTKGYPRSINIICDHCLLSAFVKRVHQIDPAIVKDSAADLMHPSQLNEAPLRPLDNKPKPAALPQADIQPAARPKAPPGATTQTTKPIDPSGPSQTFASLLQTFLRKPAYLLTVAVLLAVLVWFNFRDDPYFRRQAAWLFPTLNQENQASVDSEPIQSSTLNKHPGAPQDKPGPILRPTDLATQDSTEQQLVNTAAAPPDQRTPPVVMPPAVRSEDLAAPPNEKAAAAEMVIDVPPSSAIPVASETAAPPLLSEEKGGTELAAPLATTGPSATVSTPEEAPSETKPDQATTADPIEAPAPSAPPLDASTAMIDNQPQALPTATLVKPSATEIEFRNSEAEAPAEIKPEQTTPSDPVDAPSPEVPPIDAAAAVADEQPQALSNTALAEPPAGEPVFQDTENDPRAIIDFVIRKRSRQTGNQ